jgi:hypothetical protein
MFCNGCGQTLEPGQNFCAKCGQPVGVAAIPRRLNRVAEHSKLLGILWMVYAAFYILGGLGVFVVGNAVLSMVIRQAGANAGAEMPPPELFHFVFTVFGLLLLILGGLGFFTGWGLLQHSPWARILALVLGFLALLNMPFGTALGIYTIWVLLSANADKEYAALAQAQAA